MLVRNGTVKLINCRMVLNQESVTKIGVIILPGAKLEATRTKFIGLGTGIDIHNSGEAVLTECSFELCNEGIQVFYNSV